MGWRRCEVTPWHFYCAVLGNGLVLQHRAPPGAKSSPHPIPWHVATRVRMCVCVFVCVHSPHAPTGASLGCRIQGGVGEGLGLGGAFLTSGFGLLAPKETALISRFRSAPLSPISFWKLELHNYPKP